MKCPDCDEPTRVTETRTPENLRYRWVTEFAVSNPDLLARRRKCPVHGTYITLELPMAALQALVAREFPCLS